MSARSTRSEMELPGDLSHRMVRASDGAKIHVVERGEGPPLVLLHGVLLSSAAWPYQLRELSSSFRVVSIDLRGHGRSGIGTEKISVDRLGADVLEVLEKMDIHNAVLAGHSMGGMVSLGLAVRTPKELGKRVCGLILLATTADRLAGTAGVALAARMVGLPLRVLLDTVAGNDALARRGPLAAVAARVILGNHPSPASVEFARRLMAESSSKILTGLWAELFGFDVINQVSKVELPALVVAGDRDLVIPPWHAIRLARRLGRGELLRFAGCGHMVMFERHAEVNEAIAAFALAHQRWKPGAVARRRIGAS